MNNNPTPTESEGGREGALYIKCDHCDGEGDEPYTDNDVTGPAACSVCHGERYRPITERAGGLPDVMKLQPDLVKLQNDEISTGKMRDIIREWLAAAPQQPEAGEVDAAFDRISKAAGRALLFLDGADPGSADEARLENDRKKIRHALQQRQGEVDEALEKELYYLLFNYESDEPYEGNGDEPVIRHSRTTADDYLYKPHCGDCTNEPHTCMRCFADDCKHKARWLASHLKQRQGERVPAPMTPAYVLYLLRDLRIWIQGDHYRRSREEDERMAWATMHQRIESAIRNIESEGEGE